MLKGADSQLPDDDSSLYEGEDYIIRFFVSYLTRKDGTRMPRIFVINRERRDWSKRDRNFHIERRHSNRLTRRYVMIIDDPEIREIIKKEFSVPPNAIVPHEQGEDFIFYFIAATATERISKLVSAIFYKLKKNNYTSEMLDQIEVLTA